MLGNMMSQPLLISSLLQHAERHHGDQEIVSRRVEGDTHRYTFREMAARARRLANALRTLDIGPGGIAATLAWNGYRHLELYYAVSGAGVVLHTLNPRLHADQLAWIADHARDEVLFFDMSFLPLVEALAPRLASIKAFVALADRDHMPASSSIPGLLCYEDLLAAEDDRYEWPVFDENTASSLCYTSGTTGNPKGVLYSHRSTILHAYAAALPDAHNLGARDVVLPVVPLFHVNAWGLPYTSLLSGAKLVLPGAALDGKSLYELFEEEGVTFTCGVPTVWQGLLDHMKAQGLRFSYLQRVGIGGSACPPAMLAAFEDEHEVDVLHGWGMTETSPFCAGSVLKAAHAGLEHDAALTVKAKQGRVVFGVDIRTTDDEGRELAWDGRTPGHLMVRGPWVLERYFRADVSPLQDGWFPTGDIATIDVDGYIRITDRSKDVIKSGGEWIGSIDLENVAMGHPAVAMAACIAVPHPKWDERPLLVVQRKEGTDVSRDELIDFYAGKVTRWWTPDDVVFVDAMPIGNTGKMLKSELRERFRDHQLPTA
ncbi:3-(methylthio)propionyl-CoA ligase [Variovorax sp. YR216]|uniref:3-(methylthio)propionyl-CoA ligase n=1 Tax=Variovorax sp. YR216 TaxID=1882828 RepID=UPI00089710D4|nr:3-(methylthio)propionyl-CoA ligase [Variovorax sp. YR216]SEB22346.1 fatty-acyl-CoA synthase [Variovorax sp. YR216]